MSDARKTNRFGLSRTIQRSVAREVRQRDGFGCVVCGAGIYDYEHIDPEFKDAEEHKVDGIILLCDSCHRKKGNFLSIASIKTAAANPFCRRVGFSTGPFDFGDRLPEIVIGELTIREVETILTVDGERLFWIARSEEGGPVLLNARFFNEDGDLILEVIDNEWRPYCDNWDVEVIGPRIIIRNAPRDFALILRSEPPERLVVERLRMAAGSSYIEAEEGKSITVANRSGAVASGQGWIIEGSEVAIKIEGSSVAMACGGGSFRGSKMQGNSTGKKSLMRNKAGVAGRHAFTFKTSLAVTTSWRGYGKIFE